MNGNENEPQAPQGDDTPSAAPEDTGSQVQASENDPQTHEIGSDDPRFTDPSESPSDDATPQDDPDFGEVEDETEPSTPQLAECQNCQMLNQVVGTHCCHCNKIVKAPVADTE